MKQFFSISLICIGLLTYCWAQQAEKQIPKSKVNQNTEETSFEKIAFTELKEKDLLKLLDVWPAIKPDIIKLDIELKDDVLKQQGPDEILRAFLEPYAQLNKRIPDLEAKLKAAGMPWNEFWPAFAKTITIHFFMGLSSNFNLQNALMERKENEQKLKDPQVPESEKESIRLELNLVDLEAKVPKSNMEIFFKYEDQTMSMFDDY